ncbi:hypothetical protein Nepgr_007363 [Nepenthes gracilis]|uniref:AAA+ ATPase domain-containing protein n=1 Tax=Nepenthes gracilis TaxID=150966 RepID=A0AAD3S6P7_NEPGR|nr:hypothetical protein Nepgr_007363 [Nepenthes gracilis]
MTRAVRNRILKDANGDISEHLRNHIHLTNCIHLKNHMHKHSPILRDRSLMRDLIVLQRSRSLRDPSASPPSWNSPLGVDMLSKNGEGDAAIGGARSTSIEHPRDVRRLSRSLPHEGSATSKVAPGPVDGGIHGVALGSEHSSKSMARDGRRIRNKDSLGKNQFLGVDREPWIGENGNGFSQGNVSQNTDRKGKNIKVKGKVSQEANLKTLSEQLNEIPIDSVDVASSNIHLHRRCTQHERTFDEPEPSIHDSCSGLNRITRRKFRRVKRAQVSIVPRDSRAQNEFSVASNTSVKGIVNPEYQMEEGEDDYAQHNVTRAPRNGCGMPWNWSSIHHRGKSFLDLAGRSLSCGLSDSRLKKGSSVTQGRDNLPEASDHSSSGSKSEAEALPLLVEGSGSQESTENAAWTHDYSGELGIFADSLLKHEAESDLASEARSGGPRKLRGELCGRHQILTQKYTPRTFRDLVGQNLVSQALSNAVLQRKVGLLYVFYGPHGTGKTSCARVFARALNCQSLEHPKPCGFCGFCVAHDMGKSRNIKEVDPVSNFDFESIMDLLDGMMVSQQSSQYRVLIFDDCDTLSADCWSAISKVIDRVSRRVVFVLVCSSLDVLPHIIISRCQKFFFPKLKDADIVYALQWISTKEGLEIDRDALKLIASRSDGSLRDAEMTLEQLSLLGQRISVALVQELVGLISDDKLVDLLDLALSADTVNTVKNLREIIETGVEPLALMSQLATVITDILAGCYNFKKERRRKKFFRQQALSKDDMEKLRQALKTLSEAEKQLRISNDKLTWLTAALLQLAPDQQYMLPSSSADTSFNQSPLALDDTAGRDVQRKTGREHVMMPNNRLGLSRDGRMEKHAGSSDNVHMGSKVKSSTVDRRKHVGLRIAFEPTSALDADVNRVDGCQSIGKGQTEIEEIWLEVLERIQISYIKEFMYQEGKLTSVSYGAAPTVQLIFSSPQNKAKAEKFRAYILQAFESVLVSPVIIEIRSESRKDARHGASAPLILPVSEDGSSQPNLSLDFISNTWVPRLGYDDISGRISPSVVNGRTSEIVEVAASPMELKSDGDANFKEQSDRRGLEGSWICDARSSGKKFDPSSMSEHRRIEEQNNCQSLVRSKVSLAHVIQQAEGCSHHSAWTKRKAVSIAEKLEQENLRLEPRSRGLLCWKATRATRRKLSCFKVQTGKPRSLLKLVSCGRCLSNRSPR